MTEPQAPPREVWDETFRFLNAVLREGKPPTIREEYPLAFRAENMPNSRVIVEDGRVLSHAVFLPVDYHVDGIDLVTWIEHSFFDEAMARKVYRFLKHTGHLVVDARNPDHPKTKALDRDWRNWREESGVFHLERHETNPETGDHEDVWITIDPQAGLIEEKCEIGPRMALAEKISALSTVGFKHVELNTTDGKGFEGGQEPYWLWLVAQK